MRETRETRGAGFSTCRDRTGGGCTHHHGNRNPDGSGFDPGTLGDLGLWRAVHHRHPRAGSGIRDSHAGEAVIPRIRPSRCVEDDDPNGGARTICGDDFLGRRVQVSDGWARRHL